MSIMPDDAPPRHRRRAHSPTGIFLGLWSKSRAPAEIMLSRFAEYCKVSEESVRHMHGGSTDSFFVPGEPDPFNREWCHLDEVSLSASAHPILVADVLDDRTGSALRAFAARLRERETILGQIRPPLSYLHHNVLRGTITAANDSFGLGRLYYYSSPTRSAISNSAMAIGLVMERAPVQDDEYWEAYYVTGGGLGDTSFFQGVRLAGPGAVISISDRGFTIRHDNAIEGELLDLQHEPPSTDSALEASAELFQLLNPYMPDSAELKLSGGVDSRFVAASAIYSGVGFDAVTYVPPLLEGEIASELHARLKYSYSWRQVKADPATVRQDAGTPQSLDTPRDDVLKRASTWFEYFGGDHWSTPTRSNVPHRRLSPLPLRISGSHGDMTRNHFYGMKDVDAAGSTVALQRYISSFSRYRAILSPELRESGSQLIKNSMLDFMVRGFIELYTLDFAFYYNRMRRQFPPVVSSVVLPMLSREMLTSTFWSSPRDKVTAKALREMTSSLVPAWKEVPYYHEAAQGTDPELTNKVSLQKTYWEEDRRGFNDSLEYALDRTNFSGITMDAAQKEIEQLPEGRNRTNQTFEFVFWHNAAVEAASRIGSIRHRFPEN